MKLPWYECHWTSLMISQHWFRECLDAVRQQAITWANVDPDHCRHMVSLGHNELNILVWVTERSCTKFTHFEDIKVQTKWLHSAGNIFKSIFLNTNLYILILEVPIDYDSVLIQVIVCHPIGNNPITEPVMTHILKHICHQAPMSEFSKLWIVQCMEDLFNSLWLIDAILQHILVNIASDNGLSPVGAMPWPESMLIWYQLDPYEKNKVKFQSKYTICHSRKCIWKCL